MAAAQYHVFFAGHVQGVGFRATTRQIAREMGVSGFVRNLSDGRVELVAEGERKQLDNLLTEIDVNLGRNVRTRTVDQRPATGQYFHFEIRDSC